MMTWRMQALVAGLLVACLGCSSSEPGPAATDAPGTPHPADANTGLTVGVPFITTVGIPTTVPSDLTVEVHYLATVESAGVAETLMYGTPLASQVVPGPVTYPRELEVPGVPVGYLIAIGTYPHEDKVGFLRVGYQTFKVSTWGALRDPGENPIDAVTVLILGEVDVTP